MLITILSYMFVVRVSISDEYDLRKLESLGAKLTHAIDLRKGYVDVVVDERVYSKVASNFPTKLLPVRGKLIDFGPYYTYDEAIIKINSWHAQFPSLVSSPETIGYTWENRVIYGVRIGNFSGLGYVPTLWINTAIHAREPGGVSSVIGFVDFLLSRYGKDPEITYLLSNRMIYYVPVTNPDGYTFNETYPSGLWRKNKRDNNQSGTFEPSEDGVDLNRNFGYMWGCCGGSSSDPTSDVYRGPFAFSEPESQAYRDKFNELQPEIGIDVHTYSNLILWPWGYTSTPTSDDSAHRFLAWKMFRHNAYRSYQAYFLYPTDGTTDDWIYGDPSHPKALAFTWEIGEYFWQPDTFKILEQVGENIPTFLYMLKASGPYVEVESFNYDTISDTIFLSLTLNNLSFKHTLNNLKVTMKVLNDTVEYLDSSEVVPSLATMPYGRVILNNAFAFVSSSQCRNFLVQLRFTTPDGFAQTKLIYIIMDRILVFEDDFNDLSNWNVYGNGAWATVNGILTESPSGNYGNNWDTDVRMKNFISKDYDYYELEIRYANDIEGNYNVLDNVYDYGSIEVSSDGLIWIPLKRTWGTRSYVVERYDLTPWIDDSFKVRLKFFSDDFINADGWSIDYVRIYGADLSCTYVQEPEIPTLSMKDIGIYVDGRKLYLELPTTSQIKVSIYSLNGRLVLSRKLEGKHRYTLNLDNLGKGIYMLHLETAGGKFARKFVKTH